MMRLSAEKGARPLLAALTWLVMLALAGIAWGDGYIEQTLEFDEQGLSVQKRAGFDHVELSGCGLTNEPGLPELPSLPVTIALPEGARPTGLTVISAESVELLGSYVPTPSQHPRILPVPGLDLPVPPFLPPRADVYGGSRPYPTSIADLTSTSHLGRTTLVGLRVCPVQFLPASQKLRFYRTIGLRISYEMEQAAPARARGADAQRRVLRALSANRPPSGNALLETPGRDSALEEGDYEYVIVTPSSAYSDAMKPLEDWKTQKGVPARTVTMGWIDANYAGADGAERLRNFIKDANATWGAVWFLLAADSHQVPTRHAYAMTCEAGGHEEEDNIACDMYFADLDGDWNADGDDVYGEVDDEVDMCPDVFVGRAPIRNLTDAETFVDKILDYERAPDDDVPLEMLMAAEVLWQDPFTDTGTALNRIDRESVPPRYDPITKLYQTLGNESAQSVIEALNAGQGHFLHSGHAWYTVMSCGDGTLYRWDVPNLTNDGREPIVYSIGCWPAAFDLDEDCIAERFLQNPSGGGVAFVGNSRYGWGSPGNPGYGYSERFMQAFYKSIFVDRVANLGAALAEAKATFVPFAQAENVYRWNEYEINLLGDPEMPVWTNTPAALVVTHPDTLIPGTSVLNVSVRSSLGPLEGALVCAMNGVDVYERARTSADGKVSLSLDTASTDSVRITVTAADCRPYEAAVPVMFSGAFVRIAGIEIDDAAGNGDGIASPGEAVSATLTFQNLGNEEASDVHVSVSTGDPFVTLLGNSAYCGDLGAGETATAAPGIGLLVSSDCPDRHIVVLDVTTSGGASRATWNGTASFTVGAPVLKVLSYAFDDTAGGDGDGFAEPGETVRLMLEVVNAGLVRASSPHLTVSSPNSCIDVPSGEVQVADIGPGERGHAVFSIYIGVSCAEPSFPALHLEAATSDGAVCEEVLHVSVGNAGFAHDFESGEAGWTHGGTAGAWILTDHRSHSGDHSWYVGSPDTWTYDNDQSMHLDSPLFVRGEDAELSLWCWYELPTYHQDGFYIELTAPGGTVIDTLDFIGSGGALDFLGSIGNDWLEYRYPLPGEVGDSMAVRFLFTSDASDVSEGVYVDDVAIRGTAFPVDAGSQQEEPPQSSLLLRQNSPNPFRTTTRLSFELLVPGEVTLSVYNVQGRLIRTIASGFSTAGIHAFDWDGKDEFGAEVAAGVYLYRLNMGEESETRKMILIR